MKLKINKIDNVSWKVGQFIVKVSTRKNKKYDVFENQKYVLSFGDKNYQQFKDSFGYYKSLDHNDEKRRDNYRSRAKGIGSLNNEYSANHWSVNYLW